MSNQPTPPGKREKSKSPIRWALSGFGFRRSRSKSEENIHRAPRQTPDFQFQNKPHYDNTKNRRETERAAETHHEQGKYKYIYPIKSKTSTQHEEPDKKA